MSTSQLPRDLQEWYKVTEYLFETTIAVQGFPDESYSSPRSTTEQDIEEVFGGFGSILHKQIWQSQKGGTWAFVTFTRQEERNAAIHELNGRRVNMRTTTGGSRQRHIQWHSPLKVCIPRFHSLRLNYDQYAAARFVPPELAFTPAAEPGQGGTYQASRKPTTQSPYHHYTPTSPQRARAQSSTTLPTHDFADSYDRPPSRADSHDGLPIQWGHEPPAVMPETSGSYSDSDATYYESGKSSRCDDLFRGEASRGRDTVDDSRHRRAASPSERRAPSPAPSSRYEDSSVYPQSSRTSPEPTSRKRRREDDEDEIRRLEDENDALRRELDEQASKERRSMAVIQSLTDVISALVKRGGSSTQDDRPHKRSRVSESSGESQATALLVQLLASQVGASSTS